jgi:hypothetical protein
LADLLKGGDPVIPTAAKPTHSESPNRAGPTAEDVDTPTVVAPYPPVGTAPLPSMLGPEHPAAE